MVSVPPVALVPPVLVLTPLSVQAPVPDLTTPSFEPAAELARALLITPLLVPAKVTLRSHGPNDEDELAAVTSAGALRVMVPLPMAVMVSGPLSSAVPLETVMP